MNHAAGLAYRSAGDSNGNERVALLVHGYPESSYMWRETLGALAAAGWRALAPDLPGYGDSARARGRAPAPGSGTSRRSDGSWKSSSSVRWRS